MFPQTTGALSAPQAPAAPAAPQTAPQTMQPLGAPGTPASPQALPYNYFPAPRIGPAAAGAPARPMSPMIQSTGTQISDALGAAGTAPRPPQPQNQQTQQSPWPGMFPQGGQQGGAGQPFGGALGQQLQALMANLGQGQGFGGGFNWRGQQGQGAPGQSPEANRAPNQDGMWPGMGGFGGRGFAPRNFAPQPQVAPQPQPSYGSSLNFYSPRPSLAAQDYAQPQAEPQNFRPIMGGGGWS